MGRRCYYHALLNERTRKPRQFLKFRRAVEKSALIHIILLNHTCLGEATIVIPNYSAGFQREVANN